jgi:hypothetical protein
MKYILFLLAMVGVVHGASLIAEVSGVSDFEACTEEVKEALFDECVVDEAVSIGFNHTRRLELSDNRELGASTSYCWYQCDNAHLRRLTVAGEHVHTARFLSEKGRLEDAAVGCLHQKITEGFQCLGNPDDLTVTIVVSDPVDLGSACNYAVLAKNGISTVPNSVVTGDIGVSSVTSAGITGFALVLDSSGEFSTSSQVVGKAYASDSGTTEAFSAMETAYNNVSNRTSTGILTTATIGRKSLTPGVYTSTAAVVSINSDLTFHGGPDDVFVIQTTGDLTQAANTHVLLKGGAQAKNIFWQVAGFVEIGAGASMQGILLVKTKVDFITGSSLVGSVLAQTAVNLQMANITQAAGTCNN